MSKAQWPKIRARTYRWQDKSGMVHQGSKASDAHYGRRLLPPCAAGATDWLEKLAFPANLFTRDHAFHVASARFTTPGAWSRGSKGHN